MTKFEIQLFLTLMGMIAVFIAIILFAVPLAGLLGEWVLENIFSKEVDDGLYWTGVAIIDVCLIVGTVCGGGVYWVRDD